MVDYPIMIFGLLFLDPETILNLVLPGIAWGKKDATRIDPELGGVEV